MTALLQLALALLAPATSAQETSDDAETLLQNLFKSGDTILEAFAPVAAAVRYSIAKLDLDGSTVALAAILDTNGLAVTKASEIKPGKLTAWLAGGKEVSAELIVKDEENDVALVKVSAQGLKPIEWAAAETFVGQWAVTPGIELAPQAVGIISVPPRKILHPRALIGVQLDFNSATAKIGQILPGLGAEKAGLKAGDELLAVNDAPVKKREELVKTLRNFHEGQSVKLRVRRDAEEFDASVPMMTPKPDRGALWFDRQERMNRFGSPVSERAEGFDAAIQHDSVLQPWQCGGPLVNLDGKVVGLNIARAGRVASYALPAELVKQIIAKLKAQASQH